MPAQSSTQRQHEGTPRSGLVFPKEFEYNWWQTLDRRFSVTLVASLIIHFLVIVYFVKIRQHTMWRGCKSSLPGLSWKRRQAKPNLSKHRWMLRLKSYPQRSRRRVLLARLRASSIPERRGEQQGKAAAREMTPESREVEAVKLPERVARQRAGALTRSYSRTSWQSRFARPVDEQQRNGEW